jgi:hydroxyacylglutathione hydrolase
MKVEQIYTGCLAEAAYYIESDGEAAIVDPLREVAPYIEMAESRDARIKYVLETHFHADFVSGHIDLAKKTGAEIVFGPNATPNYEAHIAKDEEILPLGKVKIKVLHTPGHTMESTTYLLIDEEGKEHAIFTGDTLFIGDVGRPDLAVKTDLSREDLASHLYDSLRNKIMTLPDDVIVYPGHGAGSACGKNMSTETVDTLGHQKMTNYALKADMTREEFIKEVTEGLVEPPQYFPKNAVMNKMGYDSFDEVLNQGNTPLSAKEFEAVANATGAVVLDTRHQDEFAKEHIPGSIFIGIDDNFAPWVGALIVDLKQPIVFVAEEGREEEVVTRLSRVGYDNTLGYLKGGIKEWKDAGFDVDTIEQTTAFEFEKHHHKDYELLDVRKESEYESQHVVGFRNFPLDFINKHMAELDRHKGYYLHCQGGYRSMITASILKSRGFEKVVNIKGGFNALKETDLKLTDFHEQVTML